MTIAKKRKKSTRAAMLTLTPLLDLFTIIVVFLIMSFDDENYGFKLNPGVQPPLSTASSAFRTGLPVAITLDKVEVDGQMIVALDKGRATDALYASRLSEPLVKRFSELYAERFAADDVSPADIDPEDAAAIEDDAILIVQAHKDLDYRTLHLVLNSAREAGFFKYRLAVIRK